MMNAHPTKKIRVLLVDDHTIVRQGLRRVLESDGEIEVAGEASDGRTATRLAESLRPDVVVMDVGLPELNGVEAARHIASRCEGTRVVMLTMHADDVYVRHCLRAGASGYLVKDADELELVRAVKAVNRGGSFFSPAVSRVLVQGYLDESPRDADDAASVLTGREREVLQLVAEGRTNKDIANVLGVSVNTVETHRKHLMEKLDLHNTAELVRYALRNKVVH